MIATRRIVQADGLHWNVMEQGDGPVILLVHGTGASVHSWRKLMPLLAEHHHVITIDLPGHGGTSSRGAQDLSLDRMARGVGALMDVMKTSPASVAGHSAGAAILVAACVRQTMKPARLISFNGAFFPFDGIAGSLFSPFAKLIAASPFMPRILSGVASRTTVERLLRDTGSKSTAEDITLYFDLFKRPSHVAAALGMMAAWDLSGMVAMLGQLKVPSLFVASDGDKTISPKTADRAASHCPVANVLHIADYGHLLHEENPQLVADIILERKQ